MSSALVGVLLGSRADFTALRKGLETLRVMGVPYEFEVAAPERTPDKVIEWAREAAARGLEVIIAASGGSAPLAGLVAANTGLPVIGLPIDSTPLRGQDALTSMAQMPSGAPVACVGVNASENAVLLAVRILALKHPHYERVLHHQNQSAIVRQETALQELRVQYPDLTDSRVTAPDDNRLFLTELETDPGFLLREDQAEGEIVASRPPETGSSAKATVPRIEPEPAQPQEPGPPSCDEEDESETETPEPVEQPTRGKAKKSGKRSGSRKKASRAAAEAVTPSPAEDSDDTEDQEQEKSAVQTPLPPRRPGRRPLVDRLFHVEPENPDVDVIEHAMFTLLEGGIVAVPTDTVYGIAVDATNAEAVERLYRLKGRNRQKAMAILVHNAEMLSRLVTRFPEKVEELMEEFWPGSLTMIFPKPAGALAGVSASKTIGVRIPDHNTTLALISMIARPLATTSANLAGQPAATTIEEVINTFGDSLDCLIDSGPAPGLVASTVLSVAETPYKILREGAVPREDVERILGDLLAQK